VARARDAAVNQNQVLLRHDFHDLLAQHAARGVAVLTRHLHAELHATRSHVGTDGTTVTTILVRTVGTNVTGEVMATHDAREAATLGRALHVDELAFFEERVHLERGADFHG